MGLCSTYHPNLNVPVAMLTSELIYKSTCGNLKGQKWTVLCHCQTLKSSSVTLILQKATQL